MSITIEVDAAALGLRSTSGEAGAQPPHSITSHSANPTDRFNREINAAFTDLTMKARLLDTGGAVLPDRPRNSGDRCRGNGEVGQGDQDIQAEP